MKIPNMCQHPYKLFIDDERFPPGDGERWLIARNIVAVQQIIKHHGFPSFISFDHDLSINQPTGMDIAHWIVNHDMDFDVIPPDFDFYVHSQNPVGAENIECLLRSYLKFKHTA